MELSEYLSALKGRRVAVIGMGVSNTPLIELLLKNGISVTACDRNPRDKFNGLAERLESMGAQLSLGEDYLKNLDHDVIFKTPGIRPDIPELVAAKERGSTITSEMEAFFSVCPCKIIAVTGSDGKTTTTTIIAKLLEAAGYRVHLGGNIGKPLLAEADKISVHDYAVVELSSFQLMTMRQSAAVAVVTNISPNHLDYHSSMEEYAEAKKNIFCFQKPGDLLVINADNAATAAFAAEAKGCVRKFSRETAPGNGCWFDGQSIWYNNGKFSLRIIERESIRLPGLHNIENYMAAFAAVMDIVGENACRRVAGEFAGVEHRIEFVREKDGVRYYNDSIASSPTRSIAGLRSFRQQVIMIAGGYDKHISYDVIGPEICSHVKKLVLVGATSAKIKQAVLTADSSGKPEIFEFDSFEAAVRGAAELAEAGDVVILSPASASFDLFKNFMERGERFKAIINTL